MSTKFSSLLLLALLLVHCEMIMLGEAAMCSTPSRVFKGICLRNSNCSVICEKEGYEFGKCKRLKCRCETNCGGGGSGPGNGDYGGQNPRTGDGGDQGGDGGNGGGQGGDDSQGGDAGQDPPSN